MTHQQFLTLTYLWIGLALIVFVVNLFVKAPYGRHTHRNWGPLIDNRLGWIIMELPALVVCPLFFYFGSGEKGVVACLAVGLWLLHYVHRVLVYPFRIKTRGKRIPLAIVGSAIFFNCINGFLCGYFLGNLATYPAGWMSSLPFVVGLLLFVGGMGVNLHSDTILIGLRKPGETGYKIPRGGLFRWISCPNHFGEIVEWVGFALMTWSAPTLAFAVWTAANLIPRALAHHGWYHRQFPDYPAGRRAVLPFVV